MRFESYCGGDDFQQLMTLKYFLSFTCIKLGNFSFCVPDWNESYTGLEIQCDSMMNYPLNVSVT